MTAYPSGGAATFTELQSALLERFEETASPWDASPTIVAARVAFTTALQDMNRAWLLMLSNTRAQRASRERKASEAQAKAEREKAEAKARADREARHVLQTEQDRLERLKRAKDYLAQQTKA